MGGNLYWNEQRNKRTFEEAAQEAKRELYPELFFADHEPSINVCRVCAGEGFHKESCKLRNPDGRDKPLVEDLLDATDKTEVEKKSLLDVERERLKALDLSPSVEKVKKATNIPTTETAK